MKMQWCILSPARNLSARVIIGSVLMLLVSGCDITSPEPASATGITNLSTVEYEIGNFRSGAHVVGSITLTLPRDLVTFNVREVRFYLDSVCLQTQSELPKPCTYSLYTPNYTQGPHLLYIAVYEAVPSMGMMNLLDSPRIIFVTSAYFGQQTLPQ